jgi:uncharacterized protein (DUF1786 family)
MNDNAIFAIDVGAGTQDVLLFDPEQGIENSVKLVLPSPTRIAARRIQAVTRLEKTLFLTGRVMGGGAVSSAVRSHLEAGLAAYSLPEPALTLHDNLDRVRAMGLKVVEARPDGEIVEVRLGDLDTAAFEQALALFEVPLPETAAVALQDHGFSPHASNRLARFGEWRRFLEAGGSLDALLYSSAPPHLTRLAAAEQAWPGAFLMDTGAAAIRGALLDAFAAERAGEGLVVLNAGNSHTAAALVRGDRVWGVYEHHTGLLTAARLADQIGRFREGVLGHDEIFAQHGHGVAYREGYRDFKPFEAVVVTGPQREVARGLGHLAAPFGEMMLSGCFGLVEAVRRFQKKPGIQA